jgi:hypothetical protein
MTKHAAIAGCPEVAVPHTHKLFCNTIEADYWTSPTPTIQHRTSIRRPFSFSCVKPE